MKRIFALLLTLVLLASSGAALAAGGYTDVPDSHWAAASIQSAKTYGLMSGMTSNTFGLGQTITRAQFVTVTARMLGWDTKTTTASGFADTKGHWAEGAISAAVQHGALDKGGSFRPDAAISREDMAVILVRALGYQSVAEKAAGYALPFTDVKNNKGYVTVAYDIGLTNGVSATQFAPAASATREQAATMLVRIYEKYTAKTTWLHAFYAISSYSQIGLTQSMDAVSLGWSRMTYAADTGAVLHTTTSGGNVYAIPSGYADAVKQLQANGCQLNLSVFMDNNGGALAAMLADANGRSQAVQAILTEATRTYTDLGSSPYTGVTIDFEGLAGSTNQANFTAFLQALSQQLQAKNLRLVVAVMPATADGAYYNGYDYRVIGDLADKVILMAHDYQPSKLTGYTGTTYYKNAALTPFQSVYDSLRVATDPNTGVQDTSKLALAISSAANAWQVDANGKLVSETPTFPTASTLLTRMKGGATMGWSDTYRNPYLTYQTEDGKHWFVWYEDSRSVGEKVRLAKLFGVTSVSLWRLGNLPADSTDGLYYNVLSACQ